MNRLAVPVNWLISLHFMDQLKAINSFLHSADTQNFSKASRELGLSPQAVSKHVMQLEELTGVRLFNRTTHQINLTEEGRRFYEKCKIGMDAIEEGLRELTETHTAAVGTVRLAAPYFLSRKFIAPLLGKFAEKFPEVSIEFIIADHFTDIVDKNIDVAIRVGDLQDSSLIARKIATVKLMICAAPGYLAHHGEPQSAEELTEHQLVNLRNAITGKEWAWSFRVNGNVVERQLPSRYCVNDIDTQLHAVLGGAGISQLASLVASPYLSNGELVNLLPHHTVEGHSMYVITPHRTGLPLRTKALADFLYKELRTHPDL